jgi:hypothetical protein
MRLSDGKSLQVDEQGVQGNNDWTKPVINEGTRWRRRLYEIGSVLQE